MSNPKKCTLWDLVASTNPQYYCLLVALGLEFLLMAFRGYGFYFIENYMIVPTMLFLGMAFGKKLVPTARRQLLLSLGMVLWFFIAQTLHYIMDMEVRSLGLFTSIYLLAYLFASFSQDGKKQLGLNLAALAYIAAALVLVGLSTLMMLDILPGFLEPHVFWDGARLSTMWHPNMCAAIFMMGMVFCLYFFAQTQKKSLKVLFVILAVVLFFFMTLTNSRTSIFMACCVIGGFLFFCIYNGTWKRFIVGAAAALAVIVLLFNTAGMIFETHNDLLIAKYMKQAEETPPQSDDTVTDTPAETTPQIYTDHNTGKLVLETDAGQTSLAASMASLNGRTTIWASGFQAMQDNPKILFLGIDYTETLLSHYWVYSVAHAHNAWLETLMCLGLPGLVFALIFTGVAAWYIWVTFWGKCTLAQKTIALLVLSLLGTGILEPYLFFTDIYYHYTDFIFFLCLGYLTQWRTERTK